MIELLISKHADPYILTHKNFSVVHSAVEGGAIPVLAYFYYTCGFDFEIKNSFGMTPFLYSVLLGYGLFALTERRNLGILIVILNNDS